jgi:lipopolysaccharide transport system ATP-binding protein
MEAPAIQVRGVSKKFSRTIKHVMAYGAMDITRDFFGIDTQTEKLRAGEFWAVDNVSFELKRGETLGIIGQNGSGKSTLLKMLNGIYMPDKGSIAINGKVAALIEVGAGFSPLLTGRENIYINGQILGMSRNEIVRKFDSIVDFADIGDFLDAPVKHYSSGMYVRLGFAVAIHCEPEVLLVDEVLSVGDLSFRSKCMKKFAELKNKASIVFVSHNMNQVLRVCDSVLLIDGGGLLQSGMSEAVIQDYNNLMLYRAGKERQSGIDINDTTGTISGIKCTIAGSSGRAQATFTTGDDICIAIAFESSRNIVEPVLGVALMNTEGIMIGGVNNKNSAINRIRKGQNSLILTFRKIELLPGNYQIYLKWKESDNTQLLEGYGPGITIAACEAIQFKHYGIIRLNDEWTAA